MKGKITQRERGGKKRPNARLGYNIERTVEKVSYRRADGLEKSQVHRPLKKVS